MSTNEIVAELSDEIKKWNMKDLDVEFITQQGLFGSGIGSTAGVTVELKGKELSKLREYANKFSQVSFDKINVKRFINLLTKFNGLFIFITNRRG